MDGESPRFSGRGSLRATKKSYTRSRDSSEKDLLRRRPSVRSHDRVFGKGNMPEAPRQVHGDALTLPLPDSLIEAIASRVIKRLDARTPESEPYMTAMEAAEYLACPLSRIRALTPAGRIPPPPRRQSRPVSPQRA